MRTRSTSAPSPLSATRPSATRMHWSTVERSPSRPKASAACSTPLSERVLRLRGDGPRDPDALLDDVAISELREALGHSQDTIDRSFAAGAEQRRQVALARLRAGRVMEAAGVADPPVGVAHCDHALPVAALQGGGVRLAPR